MSILLLLAAIICWFAAALPSLIQIGIGQVSWGWMGMLFFGIWVLVSGGSITAIVRRVS
jgi:hypothetical protein